MNCLKKHIQIFLMKKNVSQVSFLSRGLVSTSQNQEEISESQNFEEEPTLHRTLEFRPKHVTPREIWVENLDEIVEKKKGLVELHPKIFGTIPRLDLIHDNVKWQNKYRDVVLFTARNTAEMPGGGRKPWPQKGLGKARQGSIRAPQFIKGGTCHGPRNPTSYFYMLPWEMRVHGLTSTLSTKFAQDDIHVVEDLNIPTDESQFILDLIKERNWGPAVLIVDDKDIMPRNITIATDSIGHVNLMPVYGLNVLSMLKHDTLILTLAAVEEIEKQLLKLLNAANPREIARKFARYPR